MSESTQEVAVQPTQTISLPKAAFESLFIVALCAAGIFGAITGSIFIYENWPALIAWYFDLGIAFWPAIITGYLAMFLVCWVSVIFMRLPEIQCESLLGQRVFYVMLGACAIASAVWLAASISAWLSFEDAQDLTPYQAAALCIVSIPYLLIVAFFAVCTGAPGRSDD